MSLVWSSGGVCSLIDESLSVNNLERWRGDKYISSFPLVRQVYIRQPKITINNILNVNVCTFLGTQWYVNILYVLYVYLHLKPAARIYNTCSYNYGRLQTALMQRCSLNPRQMVRGSSQTALMRRCSLTIGCWCVDHRKQAK